MKRNLNKSKTKKLLCCLIASSALAFNFAANAFADTANNYTEEIGNASITGTCTYCGNSSSFTYYDDLIPFYFNIVTSVDSDISGIISIGAHTDHNSNAACSTLRKFSEKAFSDCNDLKAVIIGGSSFENTKLEKNEPDAVFNTILESRAFSNCPNLESVFIGGQEFQGSNGGGIRIAKSASIYDEPSSGVTFSKVTYNTEICWGPFYNCPNLKYLIIEDENAVLDGLLYQTNAENVTIYCKSGSTAETYAKCVNIPYVLYDTEPTEDDLKTFNADCYAYNYPELAAMLDYNENLLFANYRSEGEALGRNASSYNTVLGDADSDSTLTAADAAAVLQKVLDSDYIMPIEEILPDDYISALDADADGTLAAADAAILLQKVLDNDYIMPIEK